jgi:hypothetical protein
MGAIKEISILFMHPLAINRLASSDEGLSSSRLNTWLLTCCSQEGPMMCSGHPLALGIGGVATAPTEAIEE